MNLSDMRLRFLGRIGNPSDSGAPDVTDQNMFINFAYLDVLDRFRFHRARNRCRFNTIAGISRYGIPTDAKAIFRLMNVTNGQKMNKRGDRYLSSYSAATGGTVPDATNIPPSDKWGPPTDYIRYRDYMELMPVPDGIYTMEIYYKYDVAELEDDADIPVIPRSWHIGIVILATWYYYDEVKDGPKAQQALNSFSDWVSTKPDEIDEESVDIDTGVEIPTLSGGDGTSQAADTRLDFNHAD